MRTRPPDIHDAIAAAARRMPAMAAAGLCLAAAACGKPASAPAEPVPNATINEFMRLQAEPAAEAIWGSVRIVSNASGIHEYRPTTEAEWAALDQSADTLVALAGFIAEEDRQLVRPGVTLEEGGTLDTPAIRARIAANRALFAQKAAAFGDKAEVVRAAIRARDADKLLDVGGPMQEACEACHLEFYYPGG